jgi:hypothetical protein
MNRLFVTMIIAAVAVFAACSDQPANAPDSSVPASTSLVKSFEAFDVSTAQMSVIDEMYYLNEDLGIVLTPEQAQSFGTMSVLFDGGTGGPGDPRTPMMDMSFLLELRLIFQANPDMSAERKQAFVDLMQQYQARINEIVRKYASDPTLDRTQMREELKAAHERFQLRLESMLTEREQARVAELRARIEKEREAMRQKMLELRIREQIRVWTRILGLDAQQQTAIAQILHRQAEVTKTLREKFARDPAGFRLALLELQQKTNAAILEQLTREQRLLWEKMQRRLKNG